MSVRVKASQNLIWRLEALGFRAFTAFMRALPLDLASSMGGTLLRTLGPFSGAHRTAERNLRLAFPEKDAAWRKTMLTAQWEQLGRTFAEFPSLDRIGSDRGRVEVVGGERLAALAAGGRAVVFISGHLANWEVMVIAILRAGVCCQVTYRAANNPYVDALIKRNRAAYGVTLFAPKGGDGSRELLEKLKAGVTVALMNDQKFNGGVAAPFFGHMAHTAPGPTRLALKFSTVLQPMSVERLGPARFRVTVHEPIVLERTGDRSADIKAGVRQVNAFVEACVRRHPQDWFWVHKRWPNEVYAALSDTSD